MNEKLHKIFEIYKHLNREQKLELIIHLDEDFYGRNKIKEDQHKNDAAEFMLRHSRVQSESNSTSEKPIRKANEFLITLQPNSFNIEGSLKNLNKDLLGKIVDETRHKVDDEYVNLKNSINELRNKLL